MRILVTGKTGQVGWELQRALAALGTVTAVDRDGLDLSKPDLIRAKVRDLRPQIIVNAAAYTAVDQAEKEPGLAFAVNAEAPAVFAEEARRWGAVLVHYSTDYVFDGTKDGPYCEEDLPNPLSVYGKSKLAGERAIRESRCRHLVLRTSWVYGIRGKNFLLTMLRLAEECKQLRVVNDQFGAPTWSRTIAEATATAIGQLANRGASADAMLGTYHVTSAGCTSWYGFASAIFEEAAKSGRVSAPKIEPICSEDYPLPARRPSNSCLSSKKLTEGFGVDIPEWRKPLAMCMRELP